MKQRISALQNYFLTQDKKVFKRKKFKFCHLLSCNHYIVVFILHLWKLEKYHEHYKIVLMLRINIRNALKWNDCDVLRWRLHNNWVNWKKMLIMNDCQVYLTFNFVKLIAHHHVVWYFLNASKIFSMCMLFISENKCFYHVSTEMILFMNEF